MVQENCLKVKQEKVVSMDEQIIPWKTNRSGMRQ